MGGSLSLWPKTVLYGINSEKKKLKKKFLKKKHDVFSKIKSEILVEIWAEIFSKKKLFFLAMFKNEITTFKKFFFEIFDFFLKFFFQKNGHNFFHGPIFFMKFFFKPCSFFWHDWNYLLINKLYWKKWLKNELENHVPDPKYHNKM